MYQRILTGLSAVAIGAGCLLPSSSPGTDDASGWAPSRTGAGHPEAMATTSGGYTLAIGDGGQVSVRAPGESAWSPVRQELPVSERADTSAYRVVASGNSVLVSYRDAGPDGTSHPTFVWRPASGWGDAVDGRGPVWTGAMGVVGVGRKRYLPETGWTRLPPIPLDPTAIGADAGGRVTAIGIVGDEVRVARFTPEDGWAPSIRVTGADRHTTLDLAVSPRGDRAITVGRDDRLELFRRLGEEDWQQYVVAESAVISHRVHLDRAGTASVVWHQSVLAPYAGLYSSRLSADGEWSSATALAYVTLVDRHQPVVEGTGDGRLAVAYRQAGAAGWTTYVRSRSSDGAWSDPIEVAPAGDHYGLALAPDGCTTGFGWAERIGRFTARTYGSCAGVEPEPVDPRTAWAAARSPVGALTYEADRIHAVRTTDGHTLLGWTSLQGRQATAAEWTPIGYTTPTSLAPAGATCHLRRLDAFDATAQAILDCGYRRWYERLWTAESGWAAPRRLPDAEGEVDFDVNRLGGTAVAYAFDDEPRPVRVVYRPTVGDPWERLPRPPAFGAGRVDWTVFLTDENEIVLLDGDGLEYAVYRPSTGAWSPVERAPLPATKVEAWSVSDDGIVLAWQPGGPSRDRFAVGDLGGGWRAMQLFDDRDPCRDVALAGHRVTVVESAGGCEIGDRPTLVARDFDLETDGWSAPTELGRGPRGTETPVLVANATGAAAVVWRHDGPDGFLRPDSLWHRASDASTWSAQSYVPGGYALDPVILADGTLAAVADLNTDAAGVWLALDGSE